jgi:hypothetical protein
MVASTTTSNTAVVATTPTRRPPRESSEKQEPLPKNASSRPTTMHERDNVVRIPNHSSLQLLRGSTSTSTAHTHNRHAQMPVSDGDWRIQTPLPLHTQTQDSRHAYTHANAHTAGTTPLSGAAIHSNSPKSEGIYVAHSCLLIPVVVAAWWYWTKRTAKRVLRKLTMLPAEPCGPSSYSMNMGASCNDVPGVSPAAHDHLNHSEEGNQNHFNYSNYSSTNHHDNFDSNIADTTATATSSAAAQHQHQQRVHHTASFENGTDDDTFNTWEDVLENETSDPSVRFVRWIKGKNYKAKRRMEAVSRFSLRRRSQQHQFHGSASAPGSSASGFGDGGLGPEGDGLDKTTPMLQEASNSLLTEASSGSTIESISIKPAKQRSAWQCIQDTGVEICSIQTKDSNCNSVVLSTNEILEHASPGSTRNRGEGVEAFFA